MSVELHRPFQSKIFHNFKKRVEGWEVPVTVNYLFK